ncbi:MULTISPECIES: hypothetical protein [Legionella]|uniref:Transmembrane protein n=1 Tax=Legionella resiliens TaxID=2905958 RepID=A0ABS8WZ60_9GAMM|nr:MULTISPECIES: hypothetical protein [unclassified Legionella]MCE0722614.1 hypothetical protein [Legionella sp. 9fVS26]MCE3531768.1 hypothetical protein [Legionella sp. 8cVS16]QLZ67793.1 hypothetical protein FOLKNPGA_00566 [Legionella sp. PC1000]
MKQHLYHYWLRCACVLTMVTGLISLLASYPDTDFLWRYLFNALSGFQSDIQFSAVARTLSAVLGGVMIGWGWMMFYLVHPSVFNQFIRNALLSGIIVWFLTDSIGSYVSDLPMNIVLNIIFLIIFLIPLISLKKSK